jgi:hypothetical protein
LKCEPQKLEKEIAMKRMNLTIGSMLSPSL